MKIIIGLVVSGLLIVGVVSLLLRSSQVDKVDTTSNTSPPSGGLEVGSTPPNFTVETVDGKRFELAALKGRPVILESYAYWCPSCLIEGKNLSEAAISYKDQVEIIGFTFDPNERKDGTDDYKNKTGAFWGFVLLDQGKEVVVTYKLTGPDVTYIIGKDGKIAYKDKGLTDPQTFKEEIEKVL